MPRSASAEAGSVGVTDTCQRPPCIPTVRMSCQCHWQSSSDPLPSIRLRHASSCRERGRRSIQDEKDELDADKEELEEVYDMGYEDYFYSGALCFIEWPELIEDLLPDDAVKVNIEEKPDGTRSVIFE